MKKLNELVKCKYDIPILDIKTDSREVKKGDLFVAIHGFNVDHINYINDAVKNGAKAVVADVKYECNIPVIVVKDVNKELIEICKKMYDYNDKNTLIGITGTDGKTTTASLIQKVLSKYKKIAYIGTNGVDIGYKIKTDNTTPTTEKLYKYFNLINKEEINNIVMEVSSEALLHKRVESLKYKYAVFTNIHEDHLNIHKTIDNYIESKMRLINLVIKNGYIIVNNDDINLKKIKDNRILTYGKDKNSDFIIDDIKLEKNNTEFSIKYRNKKFYIVSSLIGIYNIYNLTAAFIVCYLEGMNEKSIIEEIEKISLIEGRGEKLNFTSEYDIVLDYAHTLNGIKNVVETYKNYYKKVFVITGAAGEREKEKRKYIGKYLLDNTYLTIFTMDDPRNENVDDIIDDMLKLTKNNNYVRINDRKKAIKYALDNMKKNSVLLILGKGKDEYMAVGNQKKYYSDYEEVKKYFEK